MDNNTINKLINKINFDLANSFELSVIKELSFVPVSTQKNAANGKEVFFVAICKDSNQIKIKEYASKVIDNEVNFIKMSDEDFALLFDSFVERFKELNNYIANETQSNLGKGFCVGHSYFCSGPLEEQSEKDWYQCILRFEIDELLQEYWWDEPQKAQDWKNRLRID